MGHKILVVEDDMDLMAMVQRLLAGAGMEAVLCRTAAEGMQAIGEARPDLALIDVGLPDTDGIQLCREIRASAGPAMPVIFVTSRREPAARIAGFRAGAQDYIIKPYHPAELLARVRVHLSIKSSQEKLSRENYRLALLHRARQDMTDMIVHDLKNPLASIIGTLQLIKEQGMIDDAAGRRLAAYADTSAEFMLLMLNDLLDIGRANSVRLTAYPTLVDPRALLDRLTGLFAVRLSCSGVRLDHRVPAEMTTVATDENLLFRILVNLVGNALKVSRSGQAITVDFGHGGNKLQVRVLDRGPGVPAERKEAIFEKYVSGGTNDSGFSGTGIGLAFCRLAATTLDGRIWVEDRPGGGSIFTLESAESRL